MTLFYIAGTISALIGIVLHIRMLGWLLDPEPYNEFASTFAMMPITNKLIVIGGMIFPFIFYGVCLKILYIKQKRITLTVAAVTTGIIAIPFYKYAYQHASLVGKNALITAIICYTVYWVKTTSNMNDLDPIDGNETHNSD